MKGYIIRGQGSGARVDRVFLRPPTEAEMREALREELEKHGVKQTADGAVARDLFVVAQEIELVGADDFLASRTIDEVPRSHVALSGRLRDDALARLLEERAAGPAPGSGEAAPGQIAFSGVATVTNPT